MSTPPPSPYGQPQYGYPPAQPPGPGQPHGAPPPGYGQPPPGQQGQATPVSAKDERGGRRLWRIFVALVVILLGFAAWDYVRSPRIATVGDCMSGSGYSLKIVNCSSPDARLTVLKRVDLLATISSCDRVPGTSERYRGTYRKRYRKHTYVLCLGPRTPGGPAAKPRSS